MASKGMKDIERFEKFLEKVGIKYTKRELYSERIILEIDDEHVIQGKNEKALDIEFSHKGDFRHFIPWDASADQE